MRLIISLLAACVPVLLSAQSRLEGVVYDSLFAKAPLAGATVVVRELQRYVQTDSAGRFRINSVAPGRYTLDVLHGLLDSLDVQLPGQSVDVPVTPRGQIALRLPDARGLQRLLCGGVAALGSSLVIGTVRSIDGVRAIEGAQVDVAWREALYERSGMRDVDRTATVTTAASGAFVLCSVPSDADLRVRTSAAAMTSSEIASRADSTGLRRVEIRLGAGVGPIRFAVRARDEAPLVDAIVRIHGLAELRTDSGGMANTEVSVGSHSAEVVSLGYAPRNVTFIVQTDVRVDVPVLMTRTVPTLQGVRVFGRFELLNRRLEEFESRRTVGMGAYVGPRELAKLSGAELVDALRFSRGVRVQSDGRGMMWPLLRGGGSTCIANFFVNGVNFPVDGPRPAPGVQYPYTDLIAAVPLESVVAIEVYASIGGVPPQYDRSNLNSCGSILFWTK